MSWWWWSSSAPTTPSKPAKASTSTTKSSTPSRPPRNPTTDTWSRGTYKFGSKYEIAVTPPQKNEKESDASIQRVGSAPPSDKPKIGLLGALIGAPISLGKFLLILPLGIASGVAIHPPNPPRLSGVEREAYLAAHRQTLPFAYGATFGVPALSLLLFRKWRLSSRVVMLAPSLLLGMAIGNLIRSNAIYENVANIDNLPELWPEDQRPAIIARMEREETLLRLEQHNQQEQEQQQQQQQQQEQQQLQLQQSSKPSRR